MGRQRPRWGIPVVEDKLLQLAVTRILEAIYEQDVLRVVIGALCGKWLNRRSQHRSFTRGGLRRPFGAFPRAAATDSSPEPSRIPAPVFLSTSLTRKRVFLKSPVLENGTPGSVRGRFGQVAV